MYSDEESRRLEMADLPPCMCYRLPLMTPSRVLESAPGPKANSV